MAVIAILATLAIPSRTGPIIQNKMIETLDLVAPYKSLIVTYYKNNSGEFPTDNESAGMPPANKIRGNYLTKVEVRDGAMHLWLGNKLPESTHNNILSIRPIFVKDSPQSPVSWICGYDDIPHGMQASGINLTDVNAMFLPGRCR